MCYTSVVIVRARLAPWSDCPGTLCSPLAGTIELSDLRRWLGERTLVRPHLDEAGQILGPPHETWPASEPRRQVRASLVHWQTDRWTVGWGIYRQRARARLAPR